MLCLAIRYIPFPSTRIQTAVNALSCNTLHSFPVIKGTNSCSWVCNTLRYVPFTKVLTSVLFLFCDTSHSIPFKNSANSCAWVVLEYVPIRSLQVQQNYQRRFKDCFVLQYVTVRYIAFPSTKILTDSCPRSCCLAVRDNNTLHSLPLA